MPPLLAPGDRVAVVAPAGPVHEARLERGLAWLREAGLTVVEGRSLRRHGGHGLPFLAGDDDARRADLAEALLDPAVRAVLAARGGNGTPRLLDGLPWDELATAAPTIVAGLSDLTCLHQALAARLGWASLWSPMPGSEVLAGDEPDAWSREGLLRALGLVDRAAEPLAGRRLVDGPPVTAPLVGGTLALLCAMAGTPGAHPAAGAIAVLEDVGERAYRIERFLTHLRRSGFFDGVVGVAIGDLTDCGPEDEVATVVADRLTDLGVPVVTHLPFGHGPRQASLWLGRPATLDSVTATLTQPPPASDQMGY
jgi:muramoyltetrapeptide carboxypeptidase